MILLLATVGAYAVRGLTIDVVVMFLAGAIGFFPAPFGLLGGRHRARADPG